MKWFRVADDAPTSNHVAATLAQTVVFWIVFLAVLPGFVLAVESDISLPRPWIPYRIEIGISLFVAASALGLWTGMVMAVRGRGTPLPLAAARALVMTGPYRVIRNPMALAGIAQGIAVGIGFGSVGVLLYALIGALLWHVTARRWEEEFLVQRFGAAFTAYRDRVPLWLPRVLPRRAERWLGVAVAAASIAGYAALVPPAEHFVANLTANKLHRMTLFNAFALLPLLTAGLLVGALLWTRNRADRAQTKSRSTITAQ